MSKEYAEERIREALKETGGNATLARQLVTAWAHEDARLLFALTRPHLSGIVAYQVDRVASGRADAGKAEPEALRTEPSEDERFGRDVLKAVAENDRDIFGLEEQGRPRKRGGVSQNHIDAIRLMAARSHDSAPKK